MTRKITIKQMVKEIFFDATTGRRTYDNYPYDMLVIDGLKSFYYRCYFEQVYQEWLEGKKTARQMMERIYQDLLIRGRFNDHAREVAMAIKKVMYA